MIVDYFTWVSDIPEGRKSLSEPFFQTESLSSAVDEEIYTQVHHCEILEHWGQREDL